MKLQEILELVELLRTDNERLRRGEFTEKEFQNLCHKFSQEDACQFARGCLEYNQKLFGDKSKVAVINTAVED